MTTEYINKTNTTVNIKELMDLLDKSAIITSLDSNDLTNEQILGAAQLKIELERVEAGIPSGLTHNDITDWSTAIASAISGLEEITHKKSNWSGTPNNTNYPSEKLVKDSLDLKANLTDLPTIDSSLSNTSENPVQNKAVKSALDNKANSSHTHTISNVTDLQSALDSKAASTHDHNDIYYTESEIDDLLDLKADVSALSGKADSNHTHTISNVTNLQSSLNAKANSSDLGAVATSNSYNDLSNKPDLTVYALSSTVTTALGNKADSSTVSAIDTRVTALENSEFSIVIKESFSQLPSTGKAHTLYYVRNTGSSPNAYDEYTWTGTAYELMGTTAIDLTDYARIDKLDDYVGMEISSNGDISLTFTTPSS